MNRFSELCSLLWDARKTEYKELLLMEYINSAESSDILWALYLLSGKRISKLLSAGDFWDILPELSGLPLWLIEESQQISGDKAETISLLLPVNGNKNTRDLSLAEIMDFIDELKDKDRSARIEKALNISGKLNSTAKYYFLRLITGNFSAGIEPGTVVNVLKEKYKLDDVSAYHMLRHLNPFQQKLDELINYYKKYKEILKVYPFNVTDEFENFVSDKEDIKNWQTEWKWDGVRAQLVYRNNELLVWSKQHGLVTDKFPELFELTRQLPNGIALDGEIIAFSDGKPLPYSILESRLRKHSVTRSVTAEAPVAFIAYDIMEYDGVDIRDKKLTDRRKLLEDFVDRTGNVSAMYISPLLEVRSVRSLEDLKMSSLQNNCRGLILKRKDSVYSAPGSRVSIVNGPFTVNAVLLYAQKGEQSDMFSEFTFGVWNEDEIVTIAKANSGLSNDEVKEIGLYIKENTVEKFGPVRVVKPELVFEIIFDGIAESKRHKSGITLRNPGISRWLREKKPGEADHLGKLKDMLK